MIHAGDDLTGVVVDARWRLLHKIGSGGMGEVWRAMLVDGDAETRIAVKVLTKLDDEDVERFKREARAIAKVHHDGVVRVLASGTCAVTGLHFIAMEELHGETLRERMREGPYPVKASVDVVKQLAQALGAAHAVDIVHRDVKPENIFLCDGGLEAGGLDAGGLLAGTVKLLDFGIARGTSTGDTLTGTGFFMGTPSYAAPEVVMATQPNEPKSDLYSLGAVWFEMLTGRKVFIGATSVEVALMHAQQEAPRVSSLLQVPSAVDDLVAQLLLKDPARRPTAVVLARLLALVRC